MMGWALLISVLYGAFMTGMYIEERAERKALEWPFPVIEEPEKMYQGEALRENS